MSFMEVKNIRDQERIRMEPHHQETTVRMVIAILVKEFFNKLFILNVFRLLFIEFINKESLLTYFHLSAKICIFLDTSI